MPTINDSIRINAPVDKVFDYVTSPENWTQYVSSLTDVTNISSPGLEPGTTFTWEYKMLGIRLHGTGAVTENVANQSFAMRMESAVPFREHYRFIPVDSGTELSVTIEYEMPNKVLETIASAVAEKLNRREAQNILDKIKTLVEER